ncbi:MAG: hypothetical protein D6710_09340 [Nitrospirae bacterium]|nr:MAG: hypothetical protein D6710_09340 [Nitrospirota bacterium]
MRKLLLIMLFSLTLTAGCGISDLRIKSVKFEQSYIDSLGDRHVVYKEEWINEQKDSPISFGTDDFLLQGD